jgi:EAL domain-containing protein (putative c-di-GMP-specific phosphodiesterase class I)
MNCTNWLRRWFTFRMTSGGASDGICNDSTGQNLAALELGLTLLARVVDPLSTAARALVDEGVETAEQLEVLRSMKCDQSQGYFHCPPVSVRKIDPLLARDE